MANEYDDDSYEIPDLACDVTFYDSDESDDLVSECIEEIRRCEAKKAKLTQKELEREEAYKKRISNQLQQSGEVLAGKLNWCSVGPPQKPVPTKPIVQKPTPVVQKQVAPKVSKRFGKAVPLNIDIKVCGATFLTTTQPPESNNICKYYLSRNQCPFGTKCKFSHTMPHNTSQRKLQKFRMCRNVENCKFRNDCVYAHSEEELRQHVLTCHAGIKCRKINRKGDEYTNVSVDNKCMYIHPNEKIYNFVKRTNV